MVYVKSLVVFTLCTAFVLGFALVLNYEAGLVRNQPQTLSTSNVTCTSPSAAYCHTLTLSNAVILTNNYNDTLGPGSHQYLSFTLDLLGSSPIASLNVFIGNVSAGSIPGPFGPGTDRLPNHLLPTTVSVTSGTTYVLSVEGLYGNGTAVWASTQAIAQ
jgi:hypothetical protein